MTATLEALKPIIKTAFKLPEKLTVSQWADKHRILDAMTSSEPGQWRTDRTPYLRGIMDAYNDPRVEDITVVASTQVGKTESIYNIIAFIADQDPGPTLLVMPREPDAKSVSSKRIQPMFRLSQALSEHFTSDEDDVTKMEIELDRMILYFSGSNSPAALASRPIKNVFFDEVDKYPHFSGNEADPIKLGTERTRTYWDRKIFKYSTPTTKEGYIWREYEKSDQQQYYVPCPHCGKYQVLIFKDQLRWPDGEKDPEKIQSLKLAWYECIICKGRITDAMKQKMLLRGQWVPNRCKVGADGKIEGVIPRTSRRGFWINALYSPWLTFSDIAAEFLRSKDYPELLMNFINSWLAEIWQETRDQTRPDELRKLIVEYPEAVLQDGAIVLAGAVDVQKDYFIVTIRAFGYWPETWLVLATRAETWAEVEKIVFETSYCFKDDPKNEKGHALQVRLTCFDTGYNADEVYEVCRKWSDVARAVKGRDHLRGAPLSVSTIDKFPRTGQTIPGGLKLWHIDTSFFKDKITRLVKNSLANIESSKWHLYKNTPQDYITQFCGEHKVTIRDKKSGRYYEEWQPITRHTKNHFFDTEVYAMAAAEMLRVSSLIREDKKEKQQPAQEQESNRPAGPWVPRTNNWVRR
jgi:phage terminase large subunit GpA-like protein